MVISDIRIRLVEENSERLLAYCSITLDGVFVVRDLKIIEGTKGLFVAMPSRKLSDHCGGCGSKNHLRARFCNNCGHSINKARPVSEADERPKLHADIAHPISQDCRRALEQAVLAAYRTERELSGKPGYVCRYEEH